MDRPARHLYGDALAEVFDKYVALDDTIETVNYLDGLVPRNSRVLEVGVGTGRLALELMHRGHNVTGYEASIAMVKVLKSKSHANKLSIFQGDFISDPLTLSGEFDLIFMVDVAFNALGTQADQCEFFRRAATLVSPKGSLVIESLLPTANALSRTNASFAQRRPDGTLFAAIGAYDHVKQTFSGTAIWVLATGQRYEIPTETRYCSMGELAVMANCVGLSMTDTCADWSGVTIQPGAPSGVFVFSKARSGLGSKM